jgi:hypothetical protein
MCKFIEDFVYDVSYEEMFMDNALLSAD